MGERTDRQTDVRQWSSFISNSAIFVIIILTRIINNDDIDVSFTYRSQESPNNQAFYFLADVFL